MGRNKKNKFKKLLKKQLIEKIGGQCQVCGTPGTTLTLKTHHIVPVRCGGQTVKENCLITCHACESAIHSRIDKLNYAWACLGQIGMLNGEDLNCCGNCRA